MYGTFHIPDLFHSHFTFYSCPVLQELNNKAESKFNKLKAQAKTKIANLNRELEKLKTEKGGGGGDTSFNVSTLVRKNTSSVLCCLLYNCIFTVYITRGSFRTFFLGGRGLAPLPPPPPPNMKP